MKQVFLLLNLLVLSSSAFADEKLIFAIDIIRHGDRTPILDLPAAPYAWKEGLGQLTPKGMHQENELGTSLRAIYVDKYHLLPVNYLPGTIYVRSSDFDRTLMSAQSFLMGLYPLGTGPTLPDSSQSALPESFQPIPIHTIPRDQDTLLLPDHPQYHPEDLLKAYVFSSPEWKAKEAELQSKYPHWSKTTGVQIKSLYQLILIADTLYIRQLYHLPLPEGLAEVDAEEIIAAGKWAFATVFKHPMIGRITGQALLKSISEYLKKASLHQTPLKYVLFSAHDSTLESQMSALGVPLKEPPPYASNLNIALFDIGNAHYRVRLKLNGKSVSIPACGGTECTLTQFLTLDASKSVAIN